MAPSPSVDACATLPELLAVQAAAWPDRTLLRFETDRASYGEVDEGSNRLAAALAAAGVRRGERVAIMLPNGLAWPTLALAVWKCGAIVVPVNIACGARDLAFVLRQAGARWAVTRAAELARLEAVRGEASDPARVFTLEALEALEGEGPAGLAGLGADSGAGAVDGCPPAPGAGQAERNGPPRPDDPVTIQYTSGTTGFPKGCTLTHRYWLAIGRFARDYAGLGPDDVLLTAQPFYYMDPTWNLAAAMLAGASLVVLPRFSASTFWDSVEASGATFFYCLGTMPVYMSKGPARPEVERGHRVRVALCSGIPPARHAAFEARWGCRWRETYGTTEVGAALVAALDDEASVGSGSMGRPISGYEARVVDGQGRPVDEGETGELQLRGGTMMTGYWNDPEATRAWKPDEWARTGDLVYRDARGGIHLVGRLKDMIRRAGENIAAAEVEAVLDEHPAVLAAACVPVPDDDRGEEVKAFIQLRPGVDPPDPEDLRAFVAGRLAAFKVPRFVQYIDRFPLTPSEKIARPELARLYPHPSPGTYDAESGDGAGAGPARRSPNPKEIR